MEDRDDLEQILLEGLPEPEREQTVDTIRNATAKKLAKLRSEKAEPPPMEEAGALG